MFVKKIYYALYIGFYAGIIWGGVRWMLYALQFTEVLPAFLIKPLVTRTFLHSWIGHVSGIAVFVLLSVVVALIYSLLLRKKKGPWPGIIFGFVWWVIVGVLVGPLLGLLPSLWKLDLNSILCDVCVFTLWGVFIGYSITLEFTDERSYEPQVG